MNKQDYSVEKNENKNQPQENVVEQKLSERLMAVTSELYVIKTLLDTIPVVGTKNNGNMCQCGLGLEACTDALSSLLEDARTLEGAKGK